MADEHKSEQQLVEELAGTFGKINVGGRYQHYKGVDKTYAVVSLAFLESNNEVCVIYRAEYGQRLTFVRPLSSWLATVEWQGMAVPRFRRIETS